MVGHLPCHFEWLSLNSRAQPGFRTPFGEWEERDWQFHSCGFQHFALQSKSLDSRQRKFNYFCDCVLYLKNSLHFFSWICGVHCTRIESSPALISDETVHIRHAKGFPRRLSVFGGDEKKCPSIAKCREINRPNCRCYLFSGIRCRRIANKIHLLWNHYMAHFQCDIYCARRNIGSNHYNRPQ